MSFTVQCAETIQETIGAHYTLKFTKKENENPVSKDICADPQRFVITLFTMSLAMTPPEQGRRCATVGVVAHNVNRATFCLPGRWRCFGCVLFDSTELLSRWPPS
ncbi:hypothetical protein DPT59_01490 [Salmonella enterica subsp. enterica serovar Stanleyville]|uniref:Uncharacterized protein n=1 Tax=Salmonella enterica subsp. enterica serovar Stanleyville TaxID=286782 RepID=A0A5W1UW12_SALET|nr:hypothetical protein [Salmonella enterica subsp. enterica serovar Stanleyville]ECC3666357.1 hypothetical protein [Salmonella enterica subsp. enterica]EBQ9563362.1 hypothetical protein [Salmonella enterica subsp. enterica serovar Stanleyville]EBQ9941836.1 hypothetical protein [Salmonella enterica subsp. enterica serovar Stanleyville]EBS3791128.1 hypothetical protein [Salmonella enterica subsp. enterica serovar Stanleyville]